MKCVHCGANIPDGQLICPRCNAEVQMVPDYNPLDDVLAREVKGSVEGATRQIRTDDVRRQRQMSQTQSVRSTRVLNENEMERLREARRENLRRSKEQQNRRQAERQQTGNLRKDSPEYRRIQQMKRREAAKKKRRNLLLVLFLIVCLIGVGIYVIYQNSYTGVMKKGMSALQEDNYEVAQKYFDRAVIKDKSRPEAYKGLADIYVDQGDLDSAESVYLTALETQPSNEKLYEAVIDFYVKNDELDKISVLLEDCDDSKVLKAVKKYVSTAPEFSLKEGSYTEVQQVSLSSETGGDIYYTTDGSEPTSVSQKYSEAILLQEEGVTEIRAIAVNKAGVPSVVASAKYTIAFPVADAPAVSPSTGAYSGTIQVTVTVPDGYTAYYTTDGSVPDAGATKYTAPVDLRLDAKVTFNVVLINNQNGKATAMTSKTYIPKPSAE